jgi:hypothetical protein
MLSRFFNEFLPVFDFEYFIYILGKLFPDPTRKSDADIRVVNGIFQLSSTGKFATNSQKQTTGNSNIPINYPKLSAARNSNL